MKVGIIGANGQVGTELTFLFRSRGIEVIPIVRNAVAGSMFKHYGFGYRLADITDPVDARRALSDLDIVVIAAFASPITRGDYKPKHARSTNEAIIKNSIQYASNAAKLVYFSSVAAFGQQMGISEHWWYVREKRHLEKIFSESCDLNDMNGYVYRIGLVLGQNIDRTQDIETTLSDSIRVDIEAAATVNSNTVHTVTIAESVLHCVDDDMTSGTYTIVNQPQWTWERVFDYYDKGNTDIRFIGKQSSHPLYAQLLAKLSSYATNRQTELMSTSYYLPDIFNHYTFNKYMQRNIGGEISDYESRFKFHRREFDYQEAPGPSPQNIKQTNVLLNEYEYPPEIFL